MTNHNMGAEGKRRRKRSLVAKYGPWCACCGRGGHLTIDHIVPLAKGGSNALENLQLLCHGCNSAKGSRVADYVTEAYA